MSTGPYSILIHPAYLGLFLLTLGFSLFTSNMPSILLTLMLMSLSLHHRMRVEERHMEGMLGAQYAQWKKGRYRFIPLVY